MGLALISIWNEITTDKINWAFGNNLNSFALKGS